MITSRIIEVGQSTDSTNYLALNVNKPNSPSVSADNKERTYTVYSVPASPTVYFIGNLTQSFLQNNISYTYTEITYILITPMTHTETYNG